eukprot:Hpha_TRINITY_DN10916_c0_g1::TRINITY_DN10916_c0_g1_i1::g.26768::m.26768
MPWGEGVIIPGVTPWGDITRRCGEGQPGRPGVVAGPVPGTCTAVTSGGGGRKTGCTAARIAASRIPVGLPFGTKWADSKAGCTLTGGESAAGLLTTPSPPTTAPPCAGPGVTPPSCPLFRSASTSSRWASSNCCPLSASFAATCSGFPPGFSAAGVATGGGCNPDLSLPISLSVCFPTWVSPTCGLSSFSHRGAEGSVPDTPARSAAPRRLLDICSSRRSSPLARLDGSASSRGGGGGAGLWLKGAERGRAPSSGRWRLNRSRVVVRSSIPPGDSWVACAPGLRGLTERPPARAVQVEEPAGVWRLCCGVNVAAAALWALSAKRTELMMLRGSTTPLRAGGDEAAIAYSEGRRRVTPLGNTIQPLPPRPQVQKSTE